MFGLGLGKLGVVGRAGAGSTVFPYSLFAGGQEGVLYCLFDIANSFQDTAGTVPATAAGQAIRCVFDTHAGPGTRGYIATNVEEPDLVPVLEGSAGQYRLLIDINGGSAKLYTDVNAANWVGFCTIASKLGTYSFDVFFGEELPFILYNNLPNSLVGCLLRVGPYTPEDVANTEAWFVEQGASGAAGANAFNGVENFDYQFAWMSQLTGTFPAIDTSVGTSFVGAWTYCILMEEFPLLDFSAGVNFASAWLGCESLTSFPLLDTSAGTNFMNAWNSCAGLTSFPLLDTSAGTNFEGAWNSCAGLTDFPLIDTSAGTNFDNTWGGCVGLTYFPLIDTSAGTNFANAWSSCESLTSFPAIDTSAGTNFMNAWNSCAGLTSFPVLDFSAATNFSGAWNDCSNLTSFPAIDFPSAELMGFAWFGCANMADFPPNAFDTCLCTNFTGAFQNTGLTEQSVDNILVSINTAGTSGGTLDIFGGTSAAPSAAGLAAKAALESRGWTVTTN